MVKEEEIPYIADLSKSVDFETARNKEAGNQLKHMMKLVNKELPDWIIEIKKKYK
ncbi:hypothetical protein SAMN00017405_0690 [Desulfonispora thiosulfatigenes DSM 11270]|uniref:Uncharacterized protein n=1 Tax=Desulfonispora thiosulfatigenes DSM 11270 TaxID=656914 RepID=A0A1W1V9N6_DESTI|nr:hypothetical protein SAMN00017405_0690 [Desulfonispora thiosulfatigenes DSM 11270]